MKSSLILFFCICALTVSGQLDFDYSKCSQRLLDALDRDEVRDLRIRIMLEDQVDIRAIDQSFYERGLSLNERVFELLTLLKDKTEQTQNPIENYIKQSVGYQTGSLKKLWIVNGLIANLSIEQIKIISRRADIGYLDLEVAALLDEFEVEKPISENEKSINGIEPGLAAINAPEMWDMGYTGYGHWALVLDTGTDGFHPSLVYNFQGLYTPIEESWLVDNGVDYPYDCGSNGHGTHVAGTTLGLDRMTNDTIGVAFNANWMSTPAISCSDIAYSNLEILQWALNPDADLNTIEDMPTVINNSWRDPDADDCDIMYEMTLTVLEASGIAVVFSAGNSGPDESTITDPKNLNTDLVNTFAVASVNGNNPNLPIATSSSRGPSVCGQSGSLLIKPEVSAPGVQVRSSLPDENFGFYSGTSMAAPHTSGAILLLKEAFPSLTGTQLKLALYHSAVDLGDPGEDNVFGMGIIDVVAAFSYLINEGHSPEDPTVIKDALIVGMPGLEGIACGEFLSPEIIVENSGEEDITDLKIRYWYNSGTPAHYDWNGILEIGGRLTLSLPSELLSSGLYELRVEILEVNGSPDDRFYNNRGIKKIRWIQDVVVSVASTDPVCVGGTALVQINDELSGTTFWYSSLNGGNPSDTGAIYILPSLLEDTTIYFDNRAENNLGPIDFSIGPTQSLPALDRYLLFDAIQPFLLKTVKVYANSGGGRLIELRNSEGLVIASKPFGLEQGEHILDLDFEVPAGDNFQLGIAFTSNLTHNFSGANYPYEIESIINIKGSSDGVGSNAYYYFYDWQIEYGFSCGRKPVELTVAEGDLTVDFLPSATILEIPGNNSVSFLNTSTGALTYSWDFGDGLMSDDVSPVHIYTDLGVYEVVLIAESSDGCFGTATVEIEVVLSTGVTTSVLGLTGIEIYPNPSSGIFILEFELLDDFHKEIEVFDLLGRKVLFQKFNAGHAEGLTLDLSSIPTGIYILRIDSAGIQRSFKLIKE